MAVRYDDRGGVACRNIAALRLSFGRTFAAELQNARLHHKMTRQRTVKTGEV